MIRQALSAGGVKWLKRAEKLARDASRRGGFKREIMDGYLLEGSTLGKLQRARVLDGPFYLWGGGFGIIKRGDNTIAAHNPYYTLPSRDPFLIENDKALATQGKSIEPGVLRGGIANTPIPTGVFISQIHGVYTDNNWAGSGVLTTTAARNYFLTTENGRLWFSYQIRKHVPLDEARLAELEAAEEPLPVNLSLTVSNNVLEGLSGLFVVPRLITSGIPTNNMTLYRVLESTPWISAHPLTISDEQITYRVVFQGIQQFDPEDFWGNRILCWLNMTVLANGDVLAGPVSQYDPLTSADPNRRPERNSSNNGLPNAFYMPLFSQDGDCLVRQFRQGVGEAVWRSFLVIVRRDGSYIEVPDAATQYGPSGSALTWLLAGRRSDLAYCGSVVVDGVTCFVNPTPVNQSFRMLRLDGSFVDTPLPAEITENWGLPAYSGRDCVYGITTLLNDGWIGLVMTLANINTGDPYDLTYVEVNAETGELRIKGQIEIANDQYFEPGTVKYVGRNPAGRQCVVRKQVVEDGEVVREGIYLVCAGGWHIGGSSFTHPRTYISFDSGLTWELFGEDGVGGSRGCAVVGGPLKPGVETILEPR